MLSVINNRITFRKDLLTEEHQDKIKMKLILPLLVIIGATQATFPCHRFSLDPDCFTTTTTTATTTAASTTPATTTTQGPELEKLSELLQGRILDQLYETKVTPEIEKLTMILMKRLLKQFREELEKQTTTRPMRPLSYQAHPTYPLPQPLPPGPAAQQARGSLRVLPPVITHVMRPTHIPLRPKPAREEAPEATPILVRSYPRFQTSRRVSMSRPETPSHKRVMSYH